MRLIPCLLLLSGFATPTFGATSDLAPKLDLPRMRAFVKTLVNLDQFDPKRYLAEPIVSTDEPIPEAISTLFNAIQRSVFGRGDFLTLKTCADCLLWSDVSGRTVYLQLTEINAVLADPALGRGLLMLMLGHEVAHTVQDISALGTHQTLNGYEDVGNQEQAKHPDRALNYARAHAEVDAYSLLIMREMGAAAPLSALDYFARFQSPTDRYDVPVRLESLRKYIPLIWSN